jgi:hypothetical protein
MAKECNKMKNIHILPTDKPSRLFKFANELHLDTIPKDYYKKYNIYITSDEEIKEEFLTKKIYVIDIQNGNIGKLTCKNNFFKGSSKLIEIEWKNKQNIWNYCHIRQIILTTDQDLIKDGVQAIDDEFLEWFVKNPSCERVEVKNYKSSEYPLNYKIIIPQKENNAEKINQLLVLALKLPNEDLKILSDSIISRLPQEEPKQECFFTPTQNITSATICANCGIEKFLHTNQKTILPPNKLDT